MFFWQTHAHFQEKSYDQVRGFCIFARLVARHSHGRHIRLPKMQRKQKKTSGSLRIAWSVTRCSPLSMSSRSVRSLRYGVLADLITSAAQIGRAHVLTPVTNAPLVCRLLLEKKKHNKTRHEHT